MKKLTKRQIILLHSQLIEATGGSTGIRDVGVDITDIFSNETEEQEQLTRILTNKIKSMKAPHHYTNHNLNSILRLT